MRFQDSGTKRNQTIAGTIQYYDFLDNVFETTGDGIVVTDLNGHIVKVNRAITKLLGYSERYMRGKHTVEFVPREYTPGPDAGKWITQGYINNYESQWQRKDKRIVDIEMNIRAIKDTAGNLVGWVASVRDITERKQAEKKIQVSEKKYRQLYESLRDGCIATGMDKKIVEYNAAFKTMLGYSDNELYRLTYEDITPKTWHTFEAQIVAEQVLTRGYSNTYEKEYIRKDGTIFPVEVRTYLTRDEQGAPSGLWAFVRDIAERKQSEEALRESEARFRAIAESTSDAIVTIDSKGDIVYCNKGATEIYGYQQHEMLGSPVHILTPARFKKYDKEIIQMMLNRQVVKTTKKPIEITGLRKDGRELPMESSFSIWQANENIFSSAILRDITERKRIRDALARVNICFSRFGPNAQENITRIIKTSGMLFQGTFALYIKRTGKAFRVQSGWRLPRGVKGKNKLTDSWWTALFRQKNAGIPKVVHARRKASQASTDTIFSTYKIRMYISTPVVAHGVKAGVLCVAYKESRIFNPDELELFTILARALGIEEERVQAIERLEENQKRLQLSEKRLREFSRRILSIREEEKKKFSMNLHDELGSLVISLGSMLSIAEDDIQCGHKKSALAILTRTKTMLEQSITKLKGIAADLRPPDLEILSLPEVLQDFFEQIERQTNLTIKFHNKGAEDREYGNTAIVIYRVAQEAFTNIIKYAQATRATVRLTSKKNNTLYFTIRDNGNGFNVEKILQNPRRNNLGIQGMKERVESVGGTFHITSRPQKGSEVSVIVPY